jgi:hypothetical protein
MSVGTTSKDRSSNAFCENPAVDNVPSWFFANCSTALKDALCCERSCHSPRTSQVVCHPKIALREIGPDGPLDSTIKQPPRDSPRQAVTPSVTPRIKLETRADPLDSAQSDLMLPLEIGEIAVRYQAEHPDGG